MVRAASHPAWITCLFCHLMLYDVRAGYKERQSVGGVHEAEKGLKNNVEGKIVSAVRA